MVFEFSNRFLIFQISFWMFYSVFDPKNWFLNLENHFFTFQIVSELKTIPFKNTSLIWSTTFAKPPRVSIAKIGKSDWDLFDTFHSQLQINQQSKSYLHAPLSFSSTHFQLQLHQYRSTSIKVLRSFSASLLLEADLINTNDSQIVSVLHCCALEVFRKIGASLPSRHKKPQLFLALRDD